MIHALVIINNFGKPRLSKFYTRTVRALPVGATIQPSTRARGAGGARAAAVHEGALRGDQHAPRGRVLIRRCKPMVRRGRRARYLPAGRSALAPRPRHARAMPAPHVRTAPAQYATLFFCMVVDENESELGVLDLIQVLVETLDRFFKNVCELDVIFNSEQVRVGHGVVWREVDMRRAPDAFLLLGAASSGGPVKGPCISALAASPPSRARLRPPPPPSSFGRCTHLPYLAGAPGDRRDHRGGDRDRDEHAGGARLARGAVEAHATRRARRGDRDRRVAGHLGDATAMTRGQQPRQPRSPRGVIHAPT